VENHSNKLTLFVDLDGTLINSDLLVESLLLLIKKNAFYLFMLPVWLLKGKANLKYQIASRVEIDAALLPYQEELIDYLKEQKSLGRNLTLISASDQRLVAQVADHITLFDAAVGSTESVNLKGETKLQEIRRLNDNQPFDYAGNSSADIPIWMQSNQVVLVNCPPALQAKMEKNSDVAASYINKAGKLTNFVKAIRPHQWLKNALLFLPLILGHEINNMSLVLQALVAFVSFSLCASSVYLLNDMLDLNHDRQHNSKKHRPFAAGKLSLTIGLVATPILLASAFLLALLLPIEFVAVLLLYWVSTLVYSFYLKRLVLVDVLTLASLYTIRIIAGSAAVSMVPTFWILAFSMFLFMSLAIVKRYTELSNLKAEGKELSEGRGYMASDLSTLASLGGSCGYMAVLVFALYINNPDTRDLYALPEVLWLICPLLLYLVSRFWLLAHRGKIDEDPVVFAIKDRKSQAVVLLSGILIFLAM